MTAALRIANCSGFYGDRLAAAAELLDGGPLDVLSGDWLAEITMGILARGKLKDPRQGWATTFVRQLEAVLGPCLDRGVRIVADAGGVNPEACAEAVQALADRLGLSAAVAVVRGDDVLPRLGELGELRHLDTGEPLPADAPVLAANAYLGCWGIVDALAAGADVVVTGRVADASLAVGPAAWRFGWARDDWDRLAGAAVVGHAIECGAQMTGGNHPGFRRFPGMDRCGFPVAEVHEDGTAVLTKQPGTGGSVSVSTVTAQLVYEVTAARYATPDVVVRLDTVQLEQAGPDRVRVSGVRGLPPPPTAKVVLALDGGYRATVTMGLTGLHVPEKAAAVEAAVWRATDGGRAAFEQAEARVLGRPADDPSTPEQAVALLQLAVLDGDRAKVARFPRAAVETGLASVPGLFFVGPPEAPVPVTRCWPTAVPFDVLRHEVVLDGRRLPVAPPPTGSGAAAPVDDAPVEDADVDAPGELVRAPLGAVVAARSGDKGGTATLGVWVEAADAWPWLRGFLTVARLRELLPETATLPITRFELPNVRAVVFAVQGLLGDGGAATLRLDAQAKGLGEHLRARVVDVPAALVAYP